MNWRIYRLPGSRKVWHVDRGQGTQVFNVLGYIANVATQSVDVECGAMPRAWIEIPFENTQLHVISGVAIWDAVVADPVAEPATPAQLVAPINCAEDAQQV